MARLVMSVAVRLEGQPAGPGTFAVPSATFPGEVQVIFWQTADVAYCGCPSFHHRGACRHVDQVALAVELEAQELLAQSTPASRAEAAARLSKIEEMFNR